MRSTRIVLLIALAFISSGCDRGKSTVSEPVELGPAPKTVLFTQPVTASGPNRTLILEFEHSPDSHQASKVTITFLLTDGRREPLSNPSLDRRGERIIALTTTAPTNPEPVAIKGVEISSEVPVLLRDIRWQEP